MIVGICGSPRKQSTEYVLLEALDLLKKKGLQTEYFTVRSKNIGFCRHCDYCVRTKKGCIIPDDIHSLYQLLREAVGIIIATPVYNSGVSGQIKAVMDRMRALVASDLDFFRYKIGLAIAVGGDRMGGQELALQQIINFYILNGMIPVSGGSFGANLGATFWSKDTLEGVKEDEEGFRTLKKAIKKFAFLIDRQVKP
jgi:multimeric flavodoxin WrbA